MRDQGGTRRRWHSLQRGVVRMIGPHRVIQILHETGVIYPWWGEDDAGRPFSGWIETRVTDPDNEALRG